MCFNKKYVEVAINDFTMHLIISNYFNEKMLTEEKKNETKIFKAKEEIVYQSVFIYLNT